MPLLVTALVYQGRDCLSLGLGTRERKKVNFLLLCSPAPRFSGFTADMELNTIFGVEQAGFLPVESKFESLERVNRSQLN